MANIVYKMAVHSWLYVLCMTDHYNHCHIDAVKEILGVRIEYNG